MTNRQFSSAAHTGRAIQGDFGRVVIDLIGLSIAWPVFPVLRQHDPNRIAGQSDHQQRIANRLMMKGRIYSSTPSGLEVIDLADRGFKWQALVGIEISATETIPEGRRVTVNSIAFEGPIIVIRKSTLREVSAVPAGADGDTSIQVDPV